MYNVSIDLSCDNTNKDCLPTAIADEYWIKVIQLVTIVILMCGWVGYTYIGVWV